MNLVRHFRRLIVFFRGVPRIPSRRVRRGGGISHFLDCLYGLSMGTHLKAMITDIEPYEFSEGNESGPVQQQETARLHPIPSPEIAQF